MIKNKLEKIFSNPKPIIGMIHMAGRDKNEKVDIALEELEIYKKTGIDGAILEDYHGTPEDVYDLIQTIKENHPIPLGLNILRYPYIGFAWAPAFGYKFVQFDSVYDRDLDLDKYKKLRKSNPDIIVFGGVRFKGIPKTGRTLEQDIEEGLRNSDAIVTTGDSTGHETSTKKLIDFKYIISLDCPLVIGSGLNPSNAYTQLMLADAAIVGSYLKDYNTKNKVIEANCIKLMCEVSRLREDYLNDIIKFN